jgi:hypothetical protein
MIKIPKPFPALLALFLCVVSHAHAMRWYSPNTGRWLSRDPIGENGGPNLYGMVGNNPINYFDPFGLETFVLLWITRTGDPGHAAIAYPRYITLDSGETIKSPLYDFREFGPAPGNPVNSSNFSVNVPGYYGNFPRDMNDLRRKELSGYDEQPAQALIRIDTTPGQEAQMRLALDQFMKENPQYNGLSSNCTSFVIYGLKSIYGDRVNANEQIGSLSIQTPNELLNNLRRNSGKDGAPNTILIKDPGSVISFKTYVENIVANLPFYKRPFARKKVDEITGNSR